MSNDLTRRPWAIDTAAVISTAGVRVQKLRWVGMAGDDDLTIEDANGEVVFDHDASNAYPQESDFGAGGYDFNGFEVAVIDGGVLYVYVAGGGN
jgi:hypothetical protein